MHPTNNKIFALKNLKNKLYSKNYHNNNRQANAGNSNTNNNANTSNNTNFFDSSYQHYLRQNHGLINKDQKNRNSNLTNLSNPQQLYPVIGANSNFNILDDVLHDNLIIHYNINNNSTAAITTTTNIQVPSTHPFHSNNLLHHDIIPTTSFSSYNQDSKRYYSTVITDYLESSTTNIINNNNDSRGRASQQQRKIQDDEDPWEKDTDESLNKTTFLQTHIDQINNCYRIEDYNKINSLYQSLKRNNIVPPIEIYEKIFDSFNKRNFDQNTNLLINEKMYQLLNCYQDLINSKLKPTTTIYNSLLEQIFKNSIISFESENNVINGYDFWKIGSEIFQTVIKNNKLSNDVINYYLLSMNLYSMLNNKRNLNDIIPNLNNFQNFIINLSTSYKKNSFYFISMCNLAKLKNDLNFMKKLYQEFLLNLSINENLIKNQFEIYSIFISGFMETGELDLANKIFNNVINEIKLKDNLSTSINLLLSNYLLSLSKINSQRAYDLWLQFNKLNWVPEFNYDFYLLFMSNCFHDWNLTKKFNNYIFPMQRTTTTTQSSSSSSLNSLKLKNLSNYLLYPINTKFVINQLLDYSLQLKDSEIIMKLIEESMIKYFTFDINLYPFIFKFLKEFNCPNDYFLKLIENHGNNLNQSNLLKFLNSIISAYGNDQLLLNEIIFQLPKFFKNICQNFEINVNNFDGLLLCLDNLSKSLQNFNHNVNNSQIIQKLPYLLEIHAILIIKFFDFDSFTPSKSSESVTINHLEETILENFKNLLTTFKNLNLNPNDINNHNIVTQAIKLSSIDDDQHFLNYFNNPGDWDKSYPLSLVDLIKNSKFEEMVKIFENLSSEGYCFDYDTYKALIQSGYINETVVKNSFGRLIELNDQLELRKLTNLIVNSLPGNSLEDILLLNDEVSNMINFKFLNDDSLTKIVNNLNKINLSDFLKIIDFPNNFKAIKIQIEFKNSINLIYETLYHLKLYQSIVQFNELCPVLNLKILLKSCIRCGNYETFEKFSLKFQNDFSLLNEIDQLTLKCEYLINIGKFDETVHLIEQSKEKNEKINDYYSFAIFLKSFNENIKNFKNLPENSLQFANNLSTFSSFHDLLSYYETVNNIKSNKKSIKLEIIDQMLNNLFDATRLIEPNEITNKIFEFKLKTFLRFKAFLKIPNFRTLDLIKLIEIYSKFNPFSISTLFNNILETYQFKNNILNLEYNLVWNYNNNSELILILSNIEQKFLEQDDKDKIDKVQLFKQHLLLDNK
ncbi:hypothetical protein KAFR_0L02070 [Kazachstania africana CBS 2517]|uniref:Uncharacterized protein n=1 Tax=Kazachstania africana (strain ATCC 22294 / BCRC 22015 / CBS 2517 / CECT 1963 / NBRC 1671 / NRRL Y-8276) TaxID=1071382 RepID=H2B2G8_KAZAF|nr:hypothetical protein KAFR_0L02070 [Kazachstania africana CBS 2517]CCF60818.1 hypothetical protein KAFR_0L02070 [Kazachstania africana CBS 2517]